MTLIYPNIVPENDLRLPDALTIKYGPAPLLARFVLDGDRVARDMGIRLRLRYDFGELLYLNKQPTARGNWYRLTHMFNLEYSDLSAENSYWISGENDHGEIIATQAGRVYYWPDTSLEQEARLMFYGGHEVGQMSDLFSVSGSRGISSSSTSSQVRAHIMNSRSHLVKGLTSNGSLWEGHTRGQESCTGHPQPAPAQGTPGAGMDSEGGR